MAAGHNFFEHWSHSHAMVIKESWDRSYTAKVRQEDGRCRNILEGSEIKRVLEEKHSLLETAKPVMKDTYDWVKNSGCLLVLTDENCRVIESFGDREIIDNARRINFIRGASWLEEDVGTNAIGTAVRIEKPIQVNGEEHYCQKHQLWTCTASPVFDDSGKIVGIIDISGPSGSFHPHSLALVTVLAKTITMQYQTMRLTRSHYLINKRISSVFERMSDGLIELDENDRVISINPVVREILGRHENEIMGQRLQELLKTEDVLTKNYTENFGNITIKDKKSQKYQVIGERLDNSSYERGGGLVILKRLSETKRQYKGFSTQNELYNFIDIIGESKELTEAKLKACSAAQSKANILLLGESGTGKELFAQSIHKNSLRQKGPFVPVNCGAIPRELLTSELFGHDEGAFTGACRGGKAGKFEQAEGGTLLLDEIGELPNEQQVALLRVIQEKKVTRLGSNRTIPVDVRIICATNKDLAVETARGHFRQDLYYRLNVLKIYIPALRERRSDIPLLFHHFLEKFEAQYGRKMQIDEEVLPYLHEYDWPGNVRELQNVVERLVCLAEDREITVADLPEEIKHAAGTEGKEYHGDLKSRIERKEVTAKEEKKKIVVCLNKNGGNVSQTAKEMGISRNTLYRKMKAYQIKN